jgi:hypothetical protein
MHKFGKLFFLELREETFDATKLTFFGALKLPRHRLEPAAPGRFGGCLCRSGPVAGALLVSGRVALAEWRCPAR